MCAKRAKQSGITLVELVLTIVVMSIVAVGLMQAQAVMVARSADPMVMRQALAIAEAYIGEISAKAYADPASCPAVPAPGGRSNFSAACQFNGLSQVPTDQLNNAVVGLGSYNVAVTVAGSSQLNGLAASQALLITVAVTDPQGRVTQLSAYRVL
jgi:MSHA pilin protein MshD